MSNNENRMVRVKLAQADACKTQTTLPPPTKFSADVATLSMSCTPAKGCARCKPVHKQIQHRRVLNSLEHIAKEPCSREEQQMVRNWRLKSNATSKGE